MRADLYTAPVLFLLGAAMAYGGWIMDRLEIRQIHPASIPGLVPMLLGVALMVASVVLFVQARARLAAARAAGGGNRPVAGSNRDLLVAGGLCTVYALALVGTVPFPIATALFVSTFVILFELRPERGARHVALVVAIGLTLGVAVAAAVSLLFRYAFLVRLP